jgi:hypothetical protein
VRRVSHTGSTAGFRAFLARYPDQQLSVALLCNIGAVNPGTVGQSVANVFLGSAVVAQSAASAAEAGEEDDDSAGSGQAGRAGAPPMPANLTAYTGEFYSPDAETTLTVVVEEGRLFALRRPTRIALTPATGADTFSAGGGLGTVRFLRDDTGRVTQLSVQQARVYDLRFDRVR